ncbi:hypothetical protein J5N97_007417 [Dioscorea zingiberensis]|uniref:Uncharacterized protein n=1 Tax=Dioscorea zingiberensis TaxID=325984 RepID=A0A9D5DBQ9_9LILI|nr:hypothetical protein J5N97_007417 [Dioscorea zingiberensis]
MEVEKVLHMNGGNDDVSYAKNSTIQNLILSMTKSVRQRAVMDAYKSTSFPKIMSIADLGCSSGPNTLLVASDAIDAVELVCKELNQKSAPELQILLNDLPGNDFNGLISSLQDFQRSHRCFISVVPGSFYGRLFPSQSLHFFHSSSSLHWLSQIPLELQNGNNNVKLNKGNIHISKTSPPWVLDAYSKQFHRDFSLFLKCRAEEIVHGGRMVLTLVTRKSEDPSNACLYLHWELLARALMGMASQGLVEMEKIDSFNLPYYTPTSEEVENAIKKEGSFAINSIQIFDAGWGEARDICDHKIKVEEKVSTAQIIAKIMRAALESLLVSHFGVEIIDELFERYSNLMECYFSKNVNGGITNINVCVERIKQ